ncbi:hypothetical protein D3C85_1646810 [compost metagenome]
MLTSAFEMPSVSAAREKLIVSTITVNVWNSFRSILRSPFKTSDVYQNRRHAS